MRPLVGIAVLSARQRRRLLALVRRQRPAGAQRRQRRRRHRRHRRRRWRRRHGRRRQRRHRRRRRRRQHELHAARRPCSSPSRIRASPPATRVTSPSPTSTETATLDLVTANFANNSFSVLLGDGSGALRAVAATPVTTCGDCTDEVVATDVTGDGRLDDLIITCVEQLDRRCGAVNVYVNQSTTGDGEVLRGEAGDAARTRGPTTSPSSASSRRRRHTDLALVGPTTNIVHLYAGNGDGTFPNATAYHHRRHGRAAGPPPPTSTATASTTSSSTTTTTTT